MKQSLAHRQPVTEPQLGEAQSREPLELHEGSKEEGPSILPLVVVPLMLFASSAIMATAWLGHLRFKAELSFWMATLFAWLLVLPEYALNIKALRLGYTRFSGGQMGAFRLCSGVVCITLVSRYFLDEIITTQKWLGFGVMMFAMVLISSTDQERHVRN